jgi:hypothetical protein
MQQEVMIQMLIHEGFDRVAHIGEVADHALLIEFVALDGNAGFDAVSMQVAALARMIHQAVAVAKINFFGDDVHGLAHPCDN